MRICFFGHASFYGSEELKRNLMAILYEYINKEDCEFLFGGYGGFDSFAYSCVSELSSKNKIIKTYVTPYITESYLKNQLEYHRAKYDGVIYPDIESVPYKFAISARNKWMIAHSDLVICYIDRAYGGAYAAVKSVKKPVINLGQYEI